MDDLISRQAVLDAFAGYVGSGMSMNDFDALWDIVVKAPSVNPQPTAHWINISNKDLYDYRTGNKLCFECSECRSQYTYKSNYCPNCGCRMDEAQKRSE